MWKNRLNDLDIIVLDTYVLNYYGILVFFQVCKTTEKTVFLVELGTKKYKNGITLTKNLKPSKNPLIITQNNTWRKSTYEVKPVNNHTLPIMIDTSMPIYRKAMDRLWWFDVPLSGIYYATKIIDYVNKYWVLDGQFEVKADGIA